jgi:hypothetical protein
MENMQWMETSIQGTFQDTLPSIAGNIENMLHHADMRVAIVQETHTKEPKITSEKRL